MPKIKLSYNIILLAMVSLFFVFGTDSVYAQSSYPQIIFMNQLEPEDPIVENSIFISHGLHIRILTDSNFSDDTLQVDIESIVGNNIRAKFTPKLTFERIPNTNWFDLPTTYVYFNQTETDNDKPALFAEIGDTIKVSYGGVENTVKVIDDEIGEIPYIDPDINPYYAFPQCSDEQKDPDGLCTSWKKNNGLEITYTNSESTGVFFWPCSDLDSDPLNNCPTVGGKDIYVEIDYMIGHEPDVTALENIAEAFSKQGITLHVNIDDRIPYHSDTMSPPSEGGIIDLSSPLMPDFDKLKKSYFGTTDERNNASSDAELQNILTAKRMAVHYVIYGHSIPSGSSGMAEIPGNDFLITLGNWAGGVGSSDDQAGTFMHELGHNLGLFHGGHDDVNCKPNYLSVMSWSRQFSDFFTTTRTLDYSSEYLISSTTYPVDVIDESNLDELFGLTSMQSDKPIEFVYSDDIGNIKRGFSGYWTGPDITENNFLKLRS
ncbi:zinc-dependent metalloprotease family protein [Candidatus Nitrosopumilus sediminis]|uniref:zinc-dependent metalloprotease family protein n=1 Tax=Candidatus Nitrosopumilus sediminis TaxID=1229909 RepID=UPI00192BB238|nr:zinc-dependent metalloprotease family protein [Candidatus Nitrosopumilus sediminis]